MARRQPKQTKAQTARKRGAVKVPAPAAATTEIIAYKGFDRDFRCRGFQYEVGKTYEHDGLIEMCSAGFHACEYPLDVFGYYAPAFSRYAVVRQGGQTILKSHDDTKIVAAKITITAELQLSDLIARAIKWVVDRATPEGVGSHATGDQGAASATGDQGAASATGNWGRVRGAAGCTLFLVYRDPDTAEIKHAWAGIAGQHGIKPLTWYVLGADGRPQEVDDDGHTKQAAE